MFRKKDNRPSFRNFLRQLDHDKIKQLKSGVIPEGVSNKYLLYNIKYRLTEKEADVLFDNLTDEQFEYIINSPIATTYNDISKFQDYINGYDLKKELFWVLRFILDYSDEIQHFLSLEKRYNSFFFYGEYDEALAVLDEIDQITLSVWSIQQRLFIAELSKGFKANKDTLSSILSEQNSTVVNFLASYISIRIEKNISPGQYAEFVDEYLEMVKNSTLNNYIFFKVDFFRHFDYKNCTDILLIDGTFSIIDRYKSFVSFLQILISSNSVSTYEVALIKQVSQRISVVIDDIDLRIINLLVNEGKEEVDNEFLIFVDDFTSGRYESSMQKSVVYLSKNAACFPALLILVKSMIFLNKNPEELGWKDSVLNRTIKILHTILTYNENQEESYLDLYKIVHFFGYHSFSVGLFNFLSNELPSRLTNGSNIDYFKLALINSKTTNPSLYNYLNGKNKTQFLNNISTSKNSETANLIKQLLEVDRNSKLDLGLYTLRELKYIAIIYLRIESYELSLSIFEYIFSEIKFQDELKVSYVYADVLDGKIKCLVALKRYEEALVFVTHILIEKPGFIRRLYFPHLLDVLINNDNYDLQRNIALPIYLKFYEDSVDSYNIYVAYDNYLCSVSCETAKDFFTLFDEKNILHFVFLQFVCKHEVLHSSPYFSDQEELDLARIEICNFLSTKGLANSYMESEVSDLLRKVLVRKGIKQIDYSKIYVDVKGLKLIINKELRENFIRNIDIASLPVDQLNKIVDSIGNFLVYYYESEDDSSIVSEENVLDKVKLTSYNRFVHFAEAFLKIRDSFLKNSEYGLDTYLSMRIRHGTLLGQIRSVFESHKLITAWSESEKKYIENTFWTQKFEIYDVDVVKKLNELFDKFSFKIDNISETLKAKYIQIRTENDSKMSQALFDYSYNQDMLLGLFSNKFGSIKDFDIFVDGVIDELWRKTEDNLGVIRRYITEGFVDNVKRTFDEFESGLSSIDNSRFITSVEYNELKVVIRDCYTAIIVELQKISEWFRRSNKKFIEEFDFTILLESSVSTLRRSFRNAQIAISNKSKTKFDGDLFPVFTDILFYLLHNCIKHSNVTLENLRIEILVEEKDHKIELNIKNNLKNDKDFLDQLKLKIDNINYLLTQSVFQERLNKEGGTGFPKIKKALESDLKRKESTIDMRVIQGKEPIFSVSLFFEFEDLKINSNENTDN